jgi:hypothetical protein
MFASLLVLVGTIIFLVIKGMDRPAPKKLDEGPPPNSPDEPKNFSKNETEE